MHLNKHVFQSKILDLWSSFFFSKHWKLHVDTKNAKSISERVYSFLDNLIWMGNRKFSLLLREYSYFPVNVLSTRPKISELIENNFFLTRFGSKWRKGRIKVPFWRFQEFLGLVNMFTAKGFSERSPVMHLNKRMLRSQ